MAYAFWNWNIRKEFIRDDDIVERTWLICAQLGWYCAKFPNIKSEDLRIKIDQYLIDSKFTPLGTEDNDLTLLDEIIGELTMAAIGRGFNRADRRKTKK